MLKKITGIILAFLLLATSVNAATFSDMPDINHWSYNAINAAITNGLLNGSDGKIYPENNLTRAEMATILVREYSLTEKADLSEYKDVPQDKWYYEYMQKACAKGLFKGNENGLLNPESYITRQEVFVVLSRALGIEGKDETKINNFSDKDMVADWAKSSTIALIESGLIKGSGDKINPLTNITRAEFAQIMYNLKYSPMGEEKEEKEPANPKPSGHSGPSNNGSSNDEPSVDVPGEIEEVLDVE